MKFDLRYLGRSSARPATWGTALAFAPNLARPKIFFDAELRQPLRFREAISALHEVVVGDLKYKPKDKTAYEAWKKQQAEEEQQLRTRVAAAAKDAYKALKQEEPEPPGLDKDFQREHAKYWKARRTWADELRRNDPELFRHLVPCDPVVTVAPDVVLFEAFSKDESSYGCLTVDRDAFKTAGDAGLGTTNVDYSLALYEHFQTLRSYRPTRLQVDPSGFEVQVAGHADYREEKIDLPPSWLRGFGQLQAAMALPTRSVTLPAEVIYSVLAHLKRHREKEGPRSIRFKLTPGKPPVVVLDPWGIEIPSRGPAYVGARQEEIKVWGRRRLFALARLLPLAEKIEVRLLGSGLPSIWVAHMGEMRFTLALSGWTANDWTSGLSLEGLTGGFKSDAAIVGRLNGYLEEIRAASLDMIGKFIDQPRDVVLGSLHTLAKQGQVIYDFTKDRYRYRPALPVALSEAVLGPESPEVEASRGLASSIRITRDEVVANRRLLVADFGGSNPCEALFDADGNMSRAKCNCSFFFKNRLRAGPCRHLLALRRRLQAEQDHGGIGPSRNSLVH